MSEEKAHNCPKCLICNHYHYGNCKNAEGIQIHDVCKECDECHQCTSASHDEELVRKMVRPKRESSMKKSEKSPTPIKEEIRNSNPAENVSTHLNDKETKCECPILNVDGPLIPIDDEDDDDYLLRRTPTRYQMNEKRTKTSLMIRPVYSRTSEDEEESQTQDMDDEYDDDDVMEEDNDEDEGMYPQKEKDDDWVPKCMTCMKRHYGCDCDKHNYTITEGECETSPRCSTPVCSRCAAEDDEEHEPGKDYCVNHENRNFEDDTDEEEDEVEVCVVCKKPANKKVYPPLYFNVIVNVLGASVQH